MVIGRDGVSESELEEIGRTTPGIIMCCGE